MLEWIKRRTESQDLAIDDPASAKAQLAELRGADALAALGELSGWLESLKDAAGADNRSRSEILALIDEAGAAHEATLLAQYLAGAAHGQGERESNWKSLSDYQSGLTVALYASARALIGSADADGSLPVLAAAAARCIRSCRVLAKICLVHYLDVPPKLWQAAYSLHAAAEKLGCATMTVSLRSATVTGVTQELLRFLMLPMSAPEMMAPEQIEVTDRILEQHGGDFTLRPRGATDGPFCFEPQSKLPPRRAAGREPAPNAEVRYFGPGLGFDALEQVFRRFAAAKIADIKTYGKDLAPHTQIAAVQHLLTFWRAKCPYSPPPHSRTTGELRIIHRYSHLWQHLSRVRPAVTGLAIAQDDDGETQAPETWTLHDAGGIELGADLPQAANDWVQCGEVVGVSPHGSSEYWVGVILRMHAEPGRCQHADIAILSRKPLAVSLRALVARGEAGVFTEASARQFAFSQVHAIILSDGSEGSQKPNLLLPPDDWKEGRVYEATVGKSLRYLRGLHVVRRGGDYLRATFEWIAAPQD
ncbi:MAG: hypothetical protein OEW21_14660 [Betaproteobacteria bacterium]|nr:hypothetical protein [Betaproteobacteria bacterium]